MLNPDGVFNGNFRMDISGENLNRYYIHPEKNKQPACYALLKLIKHLNKEKRLVIFVDIHAHSQARPAFIYGNVFKIFVIILRR